MTMWRRSALAVLALLVSTGATMVAAGVAQAQTVESGTLSFSGDPGDWITEGGSYAYDAANGDVLSVSSSNNATVNIDLDGANGDWWSLDFDAPTGQTLTAGTTYTATAYPYNGAGSGLSLAGNGSSCSTLTGTFTVLAVSFGPSGYVQTFEATFEQHCWGGTAAARGEVHIFNPPPPAPLTIDVSVADTGTVSTVSGRVTLSGTVTCSRPVTISLWGSLTQIVRKEIVRSMIHTEVACTPNGPVSWTTIVMPSGSLPFIKGDAEVYATAYAYDTTYNREVSTTIITVVSLDKV